MPLPFLLSFPQGICFCFCSCFCCCLSCCHSRRESAVPVVSRQPSVVSHPAAFVVAFVFAFLVVIPEGNLLFPSVLHPCKPATNGSATAQSAPPPQAKPKPCAGNYSQLCHTVLPALAQRQNPAAGQGTQPQPGERRQNAHNRQKRKIEIFIKRIQSIR